MSFVDLATLTMHRRNELEGRLNIFNEKCDRAIDDIKKLKSKTKGYVLQLNCDPTELKDRFLSCMKQLDEYMYLITDFNLAIGKIDEVDTEYTPVHDTSKPLLPHPAQPFNLIDALSEPTPSTSTACSNHCPPEKPKKTKVPKKDQTLIVFSSTSSSEETMQQLRNEAMGAHRDVVDDMKNVTIEDEAETSVDECNLPAQDVLQLEQVYNATIMHIDGAWIWLITDDAEEVHRLMLDMTKFYKENRQEVNVEIAKTYTYCAFYDEESDCYYRGLFVKISEEEPDIAVVFAVDTGEIRNAGIECLQPLEPLFCQKPPYARCCHLAGVDLVCTKSSLEKQENFMKTYIGTQCTIEVDDNSSESFGVYAVLPSGETINEILVREGLAVAIDKLKGSVEIEATVKSPVPQDDNEVDITECPEYEDPVEAVTGYHNRDEADICKHYKGGPDKTCFKGSRCTKKHIVKNPDGWTLDKTEVFAKCKTVPLPPPDSWHKVLVTCVCHYDRVYVQFLNDKDKDMDEVPEFGVVLPPTSLSGLLKDMNSPATRCAYKPLTMTPAPGELVAALYPLDNSWYRARVLTVVRADQSVEVMYVDYGTVLWVKEDQIRQLELRHVALPMQAVRCRLAGVSMRPTATTQQWVAAKQALAKMAQDVMFDAHIIAREYDEAVVEIYDSEGYSIAEQLAASNLVQLTQYAVEDDSKVTHKIIVP